MPAFQCVPDTPGKKGALLLLMEAFGVTHHIRHVAERFAKEGYVVLVPDLYYRELPNKNKFGYDEVPAGLEMMHRMDFDKFVEPDAVAALNYLKIRPNVDPAPVAVTGFCLGGGLSFLVSTRLSSEIAAAAPFYGMVKDKWIEDVKHVSTPVHLFFGGADPFIPMERIKQNDARFAELGKDYKLDVYPGANHGFFCNERESYNEAAATDSWSKVTAFLAKHIGTQA